jgi:hypothetical protein
VLETAELGPLVLRKLPQRREYRGGPVPVMLFRWDYIASMVWDYHVEALPPKARPRFVP